MTHTLISRLIQRLGKESKYSYTLDFLTKKRTRETRQKKLKAFLDKTR